ncbi:type II toxin-antitoxin system VapC family toxin [Dyadobacter sp. MSC1_007]|jgi:PIN domain nuclease of toxin-antitoxin system|uniref:type II toxin-antitoxin system VapC family toxin n=1 Tax=Dyadobacter sp. MSC1_007 TaxID=2909264 RepID=UPI002549B4AA|nr:type II toxin-antitoxin system VapC family toxin [Dyadobacter sp. MSC1_007]
MNYLLDTHSLIWFMEGNSMLSIKAQKEIENPENTKYISIASIWEISIKISLNKLTLQKSFEEFLSLLIASEIKILPITLAHALHLSKLEFLHKDPFDRLIIVQGLTETLRIITKDPNFAIYNVEVYW